ncbi:MAG: hypothetical protein K2W96_08850, partial [Gemmataceae bacterium]|nr:hypothetical protein [Gemmataceae bacterium]
MSSPEPAPARPAVAIAFIAALGLLLASFPARHPVLWAHLAAGRDPAAALPVHRHLLFNVAAYRLHDAFGEAGLVAAKALLVAGAGLLLLGACRAHGGGWVPAS